ncbi:hypothetical protein EDD22DRAFT_948939 [Suillus occidentalis]|nr:hypothetical protein EDD22DRAFT_948939 [Suillus occidentalis]
MTAPPLRKYFNTDSPPEDTSYLDYLRMQPLPRLTVLYQLLEGVQCARLDEPAHRSHEPTGSYLSVGTDEQEEILEDEKDTWLDEKLAAEPAQDSAFDIEVDANLHAPIVTKALSDECKESLPINGLGGDGTEDDADLEDKDTVGRKILVVDTAKIVVFWSRDC